MAVGFALLVALMVFGSLATMLDSAVADGTRTLRLVQIVFRHGDRSALFDASNFNSDGDWPNGPGELTVRGMNQHFHVGQHFRHRYISQQLPFIDGFHMKQFRVRSTDFDRTLQSAQSQLAGWFPTDPSPFGDPTLQWQPVPIHTVPTSIDSLLLPFEPGMCSRYTELCDLRRQQPDWKNKGLEIAPAEVCQNVSLLVPCTNQQFLDKIAVLVNMTRCDLDNLWEVADTLLCRKSNNMTIPAWATEVVYEYLMILEDWTTFALFDGVEERRLTGGPLVKQMIKLMDANLNPKEEQDFELKIQLYSAHDTTVASFLEALKTDHWRVRSPPYASAVIVELWYNNATKTNEVSVTFRNESIDDINEIGHSLTLAECGVPFCEYSTFKDVLQPVIPDDWQKECVAKGSVGIASPQNFTALWVAVSLVISAAALFGFLFWRKRVRKQRLEAFRASSEYSKFVNNNSNNDFDDSDESEHLSGGGGGGAKKE